jgi:hypothetical protein
MYEAVLPNFTLKTDIYYICIGISTNLQLEFALSSTKTAVSIEFILKQAVSPVRLFKISSIYLELKATDISSSL